MNSKDSFNKINIDFITLRDNVLNISGYLHCSNSKSGVVIFCNGEKIMPKVFDYPSRRGEDIFNFDFKVPVGKKAIKIEIESQGNDYPIGFRKFSNISEYSTYYVKEDKIVFYDGSFNVVDYSYSKMFKLELRNLFKIIKNRPSFFMHAVIFRLVYLILYVFMKSKQIWIVIDRKTMADDNAEHFFKYAVGQDDGIRKFFAIHNASDDFTRLKKLFSKNILDADSVKHRFYYMFASKLISSQGSEFDLNPFLNKNYPLMAGVSNLDFYFLQHGITLHDISSWLQKYDRNPKLIVTCAESESESFKTDKYNYDENTIQTLGFPRFDNLSNDDVKKQIVIMPTWRRDLTDKDAFIKSEYFKHFNSLINNKRLIDFAQENGFEILFKPHPELLKYIEFFDRNDYVKFIPSKKYQEIFNESSILVTDYSSVAFDFAYLKKPFSYYQYGNDFHYEESYFSYEEMGFGDIISNEEDLVNKIIHYIENDCSLEKKYADRVDDFFKYHDDMNSKRCYDFIKNH